MYSAFSARLTISLAWLVTFTGAFAQAPEKNAAKAYVRVWNMCAPNGPDINLVALRGENPTTVIPGISPFAFTGYAALDPDKARFVLQGADKTTLAEAQLTLAPDEYFTIVATQSAGKVVATVQKDTYKYQAGAPGQATISQFVPGATAQVEGPGGPHTLKQGESVTYDQLAAGARIPIVVTNANGKTLRAVFTFDFKDGNRMAGLVLSDPYGRTSTRKTYSGYVYAVDLVEPAATPASTP